MPDYSAECDAQSKATGSYYDPRASQARNEKPHQRGTNLFDRMAGLGEARAIGGEADRVQFREKIEPHGDKKERASQ